ncbi:MAG: hypothetical protein SV487_11125 [Thermodesulfobacteriota bacterium]|nr:hypothetical protein [Thermodesulfobacteriota bacterium]
MMDTSITLEEISASWPSGQSGLGRAFGELAGKAGRRPGTKFSLVSREGISYSFRAALIDPPRDRVRPVFFLADVIISPSEPWFLSVCFYEDEITDPKELGNPIPQGLYGETGYCFDVDDYDPGLLAYLKDRMIEAHQTASLNL